MATQASVKSQTAKHNDTNSVAEPSHPVTDQLKDSLHASVDKLAGILPHAKVVLMHDSYNPKCRKGMLDALKTQNTHAYFLDFIPSTLKYDGLWGGLAIAWRSDNPGPVEEFKGELSSFNVLAFMSLFHLKSKVKNFKISISEKFQESLSKLKILCGRILRK